RGCAGRKLLLYSVLLFRTPSQLPLTLAPRDGAAMAEVTFPRKLVAEFIGTFALVLGGPGTAAATFMIAKSTGVQFSMVQLGIISFAFMMVIIAMIYAIGHISGCHINPAVTLALAAAKKTPWSDVPGYLVAQFAGGIAGALAIWGVLGK